MINVEAASFSYLFFTLNHWIQLVTSNSHRWINDETNEWSALDGHWQNNRVVDQDDDSTISVMTNSISQSSGQLVEENRNVDLNLIVNFVCITIHHRLP